MNSSTRLSLFLGAFLASCGGGPLDDTACLTVDLGDACPSEADARAALVGNQTCDGQPVRVIVRTGALVSEEDGVTSSGYFEPTDSGGDSGAYSGSDPVTRCCYEADYRKKFGVVGRCVVGRPLRVDGRPVSACAVPRSDWADGALPDLSALSPEARSALAEQWTDAALLEHASIPAFAQVILDLVALGAPPELIARTSAAIADETVHAQLCFALASAYAGAPVGPGPLPAPSRRRATLRRLAVETFREGCVGETLAVAIAAAQLREATDPTVREVLVRILADESRHAELAWDTVRWAVRTGGPSVRRAVAAEIARQTVPTVSSAAEQAALHGVWDQVIRPSAAELLAA